MMSTESPISIGLAACLCGTVGALLVWGVFRLRDILSRRHLVQVLVLRCFVLAACILLLLNPFITVREPNPAAFRVAVLLDASQSMGTEDEAGRARFDRLRSLLADDGPIARLGERYRTEVALFSESVHPLVGDVAPERVELLPGRSALGEVLTAVRTEGSTAPLGSVLIVSDGRSNHGPAPTEVCKRYRADAVPVSCIGIGSATSPGDVVVRAGKDKIKGERDLPLRVPVVISNTLGVPADAVLELVEGQSVIATQSVRLDGTGAPQEAVFEYRPWRAGRQTLGVRVQPVAGDRRPDTDADYVALDIREADRFRALYLSNALGWEQKFLRLLANDHEQLSLAAVVRTSEEGYHKSGLSEDSLLAAAPGFPDSSEALAEFHILLLDTRVVAELSPDGRAAVEAFVEHRGGGLLLFGPTTDLAEPFGALLPVGPCEPVTVSRDARADASAAFLFGRDPTGVLRRNRGLVLRAGDPVWLPTETKRGGREAVRLRGADRVALAAQAYGGGRVAYIGFDNSWRWRLSRADGEDLHRAFWTRLLVWLGSTRKSRLTARCTGAKVGLGEPLALDVDILGSDFRPAPDAQVVAAIEEPEGGDVEVPLEPSPEAPGRYTGLFHPRQNGEHRVLYRVRLPESRLEVATHFLARQAGTEFEDTTYAEETLRDMARITGGRFGRCEDAGAWQDLPLRRDLPTRAEQVYWTRTWLFLVLLAVLLIADWALRRRIGLK